MTKRVKMGFLTPTINRHQHNIIKVSHCFPEFYTNFNEKHFTEMSERLMKT